MKPTIAKVPLLEVRDRRAWRNWLERNHSHSSGVWLIYYKGQTTPTGIGYDESVREALCFGWVDSLIKRLDDHRYARKFTPRKPGSAWSDSNRKRWAELEKAGLLTDAGLAVKPSDSRDDIRPTFSAVLEKEASSLIKRDPSAWRAFASLAPSHKRQYILWIALAKKPETRTRRAAEAIEMLRAGKKLGLK